MDQPASVYLFLAGVLFSFKMQKRNQSAEKVQSCSLCCCDMQIDMCVLSCPLDGC